ncbi:MAG: DUF669 domain-containing protein [Clostridiales Family XIII bacterium]|jgi:sulfur relay (sulfurtransferase) DsrC/TusE family protein|nr:DUF669 domain-containing protein [Clostridiales Family XIII bacterium]
MTEQNTNVYDWDEEIDANDNDFVILKPGDYDFTVVSFERQYYDGSEKLPPCKMVILQIRVETSDGPATAFHRLYLAPSQNGLITSFFGAIGLHKKGDEKLKMDWDHVAGATGRAKFGVRQYNGNEYNEVKRFYYKDAAPATSGSGVYDSWN